jgi:hypothetical protein
MWIGYKYSGDDVGFVPESGIVTVAYGTVFNIDDIAVFTIIDGEEDSLKNEFLIEWLEENCDIEILTQRIDITSTDFVRLQTRGKLCEQDILIVPKLKGESGEEPITAELEATPSLQEQNFLPSAYDADYFKQVTVKKIPDEYITPEWDGTFTVTGEPTTDGGSGGSDDRDFYYVGGQITASGSSKIGFINYFIAPKGETSNLVKHFSNVVQNDTYNFYVKIPKGYVIRFNILITSTSFIGFQYFKSEKLGFNLENLTYGDHYTDWIEVTDDIDDIEAYAYGQMSGGGGSD